MGHHLQYTIKFHHSGKFIEEEGTIKYVGGETSFADFSNLDAIGFYSFKNICIEDVGFENLTAMHYKVPGQDLTIGLKPLNDDSSFMELINYLKDSTIVEMYLEEEVAPIIDGVDKDIGNGDQLHDAVVVESIRGNNVSEVNVMVTDGLTKGSFERSSGINIINDMDGLCVLDQGQGYGVNDVRYYMSDDDAGILYDVDLFTDDDDEEVHDARQKVNEILKTRYHRIEEEEKEEDIYEDEVEVEIIGDDTGDIPISDEKWVDDFDTRGKVPGYESDDQDSDELGIIASSDSDEEGNGPKYKRSRKVYYDPSCKIPVWVVGMIFDNVFQFRMAVRKYGLRKRVAITFDKNDLDRVKVICKPGCPWLLYASLNQDNEFQIKTYMPVHKCTITNCVKVVNTRLLADMLRKRLLQQPDISPRGFKKLCREKFQINVSRAMCTRVKKMVKDEFNMGFKAEYAMLYSYAAELRESNLGSTIEISPGYSEDGRKLFQRIYVCFTACKQGSKAGCRPFIGLNGCFLKDICKGEMLCAIGRDGNNQMFPIAWVVVEIESGSSWSWFIHYLMKDLDIKDGGSGLTVMTDMQKGLIPTLDRLLPRAEHRRCARHVYAAWQKIWKGPDRKKQFWSCAKSTYVQDFAIQLKELEKLGKGCVADALKYNEETWCKAFFSTEVKCDAVDNNMSETFNGWILHTRVDPIISMLEEIRVMVMNRIRVKRTFATKWKTNIAPRVMKKLEENIKKQWTWKLENNGDDGYEVERGKDRHTIFLDQKTCTCREWDLTGIPCAHSICVIYDAEREPEEFVSSWYRKDSYLKAYQFSLQPVRGQKFWPQTEDEPLEPPADREMPGRKKMKRRKDKDEPKKQGKLSRRGGHKTCSNCGQTGHNKRGCKQPTKSTGEARPSTSLLATSRKEKGKEKANVPGSTTTGVRAEKMANAQVRFQNYMQLNASGTHGNALSHAKAPNAASFNHISNKTTVLSSNGAKRPKLNGGVGLTYC